MAFTIDIPNRRLITDQLANTVQEVNDAARNFEDQPEVVAIDLIDPLNRDGIIATSGKDDLGVGIFGPIVLRLINGWRLYHLPQSGPTWVQVRVVGGTVIATNTFDDNPVEDSAFVNWIIPVAQTGAVLQLVELETLTATISVITEHTRKLLRNRQELVDTGSGVVMRTWDDDGATVLESNPVTDPNDAEPDLDAGAITKRGVPT